MKHLRQTLQMLRQEARLAKVSFAKMVWETGHFCLKTGLGPRYYVVAGMARDDFPQTDRWLHISAGQYYKALDILNPPAYRKFTQNKLCEKALYAMLHIPTARMRAYYHPHKGITDYGLPLKKEDQLDQLLGSLQDQTICLKPVEGWGGVGVKIGRVRIKQGKAVLTLKGMAEPLDARAIIASYRSPNALPEFIVEDYLPQSRQLADFNPESLNTLRLWVLCDANDRVSILGGYLRVGRSGSVIDNASAGGLMCPVDITTGRLKAGITKHSPHRENLNAHPDHGAKLKGEVLEDWQAISDFACEVLRRLPHTRFAGLDIGVTPEGPVLVETNPEPDKDGAAHANIPAIRLKQAAMALAK